MRIVEVVETPKPRPEPRPPSGPGSETARALLEAIGSRSALNVRVERHDRYTLVDVHGIPVRCYPPRPVIPEPPHLHLKPVLEHGATELGLVPVADTVVPFFCRKVSWWGRIPDLTEGMPRFGRGVAWFAMGHRLLSVTRDPASGLLRVRLVGRHWGHP